MNQELDLQGALRKLRNAAPHEAGEAVEHRLRHAFRRRRRRSHQICLGWAAAACLALSAGWFSSHRPVVSSETRLVTGESYREALAGFVPLPYAQSDVPIEQAVIVRMQLAPAQWKALGVPQEHSRSSGFVKADLLVGQDGVARAVRLVQ